MAGTRREHLIAWLRDAHTMEAATRRSWRQNTRRLPSISRGAVASEWSVRFELEGFMGFSAVALDGHAGNWGEVALARWGEPYAMELDGSHRSTAAGRAPAEKRPAAAAGRLRDRDEVPDVMLHLVG